MVSKFFSNSKPIHLVIIAMFILLVFAISGFSNNKEGLSLGFAINELGKFSLVLFSLFTLSFLVKKNKLTKNNNYDILLYALLLAILPKTMEGINILFANVFILLALRRIISLRSNLYVKKKLFDAAFWIAIASLFHFWTILFFVLIICALLVYSIVHYKNWIIPFVGVLVVILITTAYFVLVHGSVFEPSFYFKSMSVDFLGSNLDFMLELFVIGGLGIWALIFFSANLKMKQKAQRPMYILLLTAFLIGLIVGLISPNKNGSEFLFVFPVLAIIMANYLESVKKLWVAELYVWLLFTTPFILLML